MEVCQWLWLACVFVAASAAQAQPSADELLTRVGLVAADKQRVLAGELVNVETAAVSKRDLVVSFAFLVKTSPDGLGRQVGAGRLVSSDPSVKASGRMEDLDALPVPAGVAQTFVSGKDLNLSAEEAKAFAALQGKPEEAVKQQMQKLLLARYQAYRKAGLSGIPPGDLATDLRKAGESAHTLKVYLPAFHAVLLDYPRATVPGMREDFRWAMHDLDGKITYVLTHLITVADGGARAVLQRQYYVSTGYNGEQALAGFLAVQGGGTVVLYSGHAFTNQVAKGGIGRRVMAETLQKQFEAARTRVQQ